MSTSARPAAAATLPVSAALLAVMMVAVLGYQVLGLAPAGLIARLCILAYIVLEARRLPREGYIMAAGFATIGAIALPFASDWSAAVRAGLDKAALYAGFTAAVGFLRGAAQTSPLVARCGAHLLAQPPGRRYGALAFGAHLYGVILTFGAVELLGAMVKRANTLAAAGGDPAVQRLRERRMLNAVYRGFVTTTHWSPLTVMLAVVLGQLPMLSWREVVPQGFASAMALTLLGWAIDRASAARRATRAGPRPESPDRWTVHIPVFFLVLAVFALGAAIEQALRVSMVVGVMIAVPSVTAAWLLQQARAEGGGPAAALAATGRRLVRHAVAIFPAQRMEILVLGGAGFVGALVGAAVSAGAAARLAGSLAAAPLGVALAIPFLVAALGQVAVNPILSVTMLGAVLGDPRAWGLDPRQLAYAYTAGWCMATSSSPYVAVAVIMGRLTGTSAFRAASIGNAGYTLAGLGLVSVLALLLSLLIR
ncbi:MAG: hypothetical protein IT557_17255 [Alphaproteobacteria bacterium]|nr:hypothetical protein [Alphaproteobacteria bacterium]